MEEKNRQPIDRMKNLDNVLDEYETVIGLSRFKEDAVDDEIKNYLSMPRDQMEAMSLEDCAQAALLLGGFAFHIQRCYNREIARVNWATNTLKKIISGKEEQYRGSWESQFHQAVKEDRYASALLKLKHYAQQRADRLTFLATSSKHMSELFVNLQKAKIMR